MAAPGDAPARCVLVSNSYRIPFWVTYYNNNNLFTHTDGQRIRYILCYAFTQKYVSNCRYAQESSRRSVVAAEALGPSQLAFVLFF